MSYKRKSLRQKRKTTQRRHSNSRSRKLHGGCKDGNCLFQSQQSPLPPSLPHSNFSQNGGQFPPSFHNVPIRAFYPLNTYQNDPIYKTVSSTLIPTTGGKRKVRRGKGRSSRRNHSQKGGFEATQGLSTLFAYGASLQPSNINSLAFHDTLNRPYA